MYPLIKIDPSNKMFLIVHAGYKGGKKESLGILNPGH